MIEESLYERLGGYDAINVVVNDLLPRLLADTQLGRFWQNRGLDGMAREKQLLIDFLCSSSGGPLYYTGRNMAVTHKGMGITESDWAIFRQHLQASLKEFELPEQESAEVLAFIDSTKTEIVG
ncbi:group I truncated hemoglobin [Methylovulum psychrotolerans]|uniref:Group 1 truncated hemoglobin n=1 Tax=Methylovulum psychrotolerans TaxID=1704499 RepID=A0A2S5CIF8_9GAMM|nr:group 1 truncated hemoglobin [Methylovulum psychrotolerans]POZ50591.1 group 1 truncated hemoglobin [Methylovulum psychrotolerans]